MSGGASSLRSRFGARTVTSIVAAGFSTSSMSRGDVPCLQGHGQGLVRIGFFLGDEDEPEEQGQEKGEELQPPVADEEIPERLHVMFLRYSVSFVLELVLLAILCRTPLSAREMPPVSSETTMTAASVSWERPRAARCRVRARNPSLRLWDAGRGRRQPAETILFPWMITAPSWSGEWGKKRLTRRSLESRASSFVPRSA